MADNGTNQPTGNVSDQGDIPTTAPTTGPNVGPTVDPSAAPTPDQLPNVGVTHGMAHDGIGRQTEETTILIGEMRGGDGPMPRGCTLTPRECFCVSSTQGRRPNASVGNVSLRRSASLEAPERTYPPTSKGWNSTNLSGDGLMQP